MNIDTSLRRTVAALTHPASLLAIALMLFNDFVLKAAAPGWLTGKLSDFAGLVILPILAAGMLALLPWHERWQTRAPILGGVLLVGAWFALVKSVPALNQAFVQVAARAGAPVRLVLDSGDLLALSMLPLSYMIWLRAKPRVLHLRRAWVMLPAAALVLLADAAAPDRGATCVHIVQGELRLVAPYQGVYQSQDGGLTWQTSSEWENYECTDTSAQMIDPNGAVQYRWTRGERIERSSDGGQTWSEELPLRPLGEVQRAYVQKVNSQNIQFGKGPFSAVEDPNSGNIVFAMGQEGVLVRRPDGTYIPVGIGRYNPDVMGPIPPGGQLTLLSGEFFMAVAVSLLAFSTLALPYHRRWWRIAKIIIGWLFWLAALVIFPPAISSGPYTEMFIFVGILAALGWALICVIDDMIALVRAHRRPARHTWLLALATGIAYLLPLLLWAYELLPGYATATMVGIALVLVIIAYGVLQSRRAGQSLGPPLAQA